MAPMHHGRTPDTYTEAQLLGALTLLERYAHGHYMTARRVADWLGKPRNTVARWRARNRFPGPAGRAAVSKGRYKVRHGWDYRDVLEWLRLTGRLAKDHGLSLNTRRTRRVHKEAPSMRCGV